MSDWTVNHRAVSADRRFLAAPFFRGSAGYEVGLIDLPEEPPPRGPLSHARRGQGGLVPGGPAAGVRRSAERLAVGRPRRHRRGREGRRNGGPPLRVEPAHRFTGFRTTVEGLSFAPDGRPLAAGARDRRIRVWEVASGRETADLDWKSGKVTDLAFSPDGSTLAAACSKGVVVWDAD
jgi:WD40 repeat protein